MQDAPKTTYQDLLKAGAAGIKALIDAINAGAAPAVQALNELADKAAEYLQRTGYATSGVVVFYNSEICGWTNKLRDPQHWAPGCIAVTAGSFYTTVGGDDYNGAERWEPIDTSPPQAATTITAPEVGTYWEGQGGIFVGTLLDNDKRYHIIMATTAFSGEWGTYGTTIEGEFSRSNGAHNTQLILAAEPQNKLLLEITNHEADGHKDFHLPSSFENNLICINAQKHVAKVWHWSSTQCSADGAWVQYFEDGGQGVDDKDYELAARAVRRILVI